MWRGLKGVDLTGGTERPFGDLLFDVGTGGKGDRILAIRKKSWTTGDHLNGGGAQSGGRGGKRSVEETRNGTYPLTGKNGEGGQ